MKTERVFIQIDGSNFYHRLKDLRLSNLLSFNYKKFAEFLVRDRELVSARYYIGAIREEEGDGKSKILMKNQRKLLGNLKKHGFEIEFGHMLKTDNRYHEKGVDVLMAVDIIVGAYENFYDILILVSSDTDLIPALEKAHSKGKEIEYIGFSHSPSYGLIANSDIRRLLIKEELLPFLS